MPAGLVNLTLFDAGVGVAAPPDVLRIFFLGGMLAATLRISSMWMVEHGSHAGMSYERTSFPNLSVIRAVSGSLARMENVMGSAGGDKSRSSS